MQTAETPSSSTAPTHLLTLPEAPTHLLGAVKVWRQDVEIMTYLPGEPDRNPMFLEKRVYQGSSGRVYPLPFIDRIAREPEKKAWHAIHLENEYLRIMVLPEIGGRIHVGFDKTTGYDFFYRQNVIKPALVGLAGPWISGGVEFNWPQHHRPATFMPVETHIEESDDGSVIVWCSDHDPMLRMKGMHGICLRPGRAVLELKVRLFNRTPFTQTFLWWANVATRVHEHYQSFFPPDVRYVADHAKRAVTSFPLCAGTYYGVDYGRRARAGVPAEEIPQQFVPDGSYSANDLSRYANIPVPTSYMVAATGENFFGGYDHRAESGLMHVANHHIAPGKKQWTWGNHEFGYAWDRSLTDDDGPYIELMAGVYTDNQPDFSYITPWETKTFIQNWYPIHRIGIPKAANVDAALSLEITDKVATVGLCVTHDVASALIFLTCNGAELASWKADLSVASPLILTVELPEGVTAESMSVFVKTSDRELIAYGTTKLVPASAPVTACEPAAPEQVESIEELYLTGVHLEQYRHATRLPELYWQEALRRDPGESRVHNAMGLFHLRRGEFVQATQHLEKSVARLTQLNPNPRDGEAYYNLGLALRYQDDEQMAYDAFYKATWNAAWRGPAYFALAEIDAKRRRWQDALEHVRRSLRAEPDNLIARDLLTSTLREFEDELGAGKVVIETLALDTLDVAARWRNAVKPSDGQQSLDLAFDLLRAGWQAEACEVLRAADWQANDGSVPIMLLTLAQIEEHLGDVRSSETWRLAAEASLDYCFPSRLEEMQVLEREIASHPANGSAWYLLGNFLYDRRRHEEAIQAWQTAANLMPAFPTVWRNLGIALFNIRHDSQGAMKAFERAWQTAQSDARVLYERDQLWKRTGESPEVRLAELLNHRSLVNLRDDLSVELATLYNQAGQPERALELLLKRSFQPWEGGEGMVLAQYSRALMQLGRCALNTGDPGSALLHFKAALKVPRNLSEARHLLANTSDVYYSIGNALDALGRRDEAIPAWHRAASQNGDFQHMAVKKVSEMTYWSAMALKRLGQNAQAEALLHDVLAYGAEIEIARPMIDYFATSLPAMLLFSEDVEQRNRVEGRFLRAQANAGLRRDAESRALVEDVLRTDRNHAGATELSEELMARDNARKVVR